MPDDDEGLAPPPPDLSEVEDGQPLSAGELEDFITPYESAKEAGEGPKSLDQILAEANKRIDAEHHEVLPVDEDYDNDGFSDNGERQVYARARSGRPAYLRPDPDGTVRVDAGPLGHPGFDQVTFPIMTRRDLVTMGEDRFASPEGSLWTWQKFVADAKFDFLKGCIAVGEHMVTDMEVSIEVVLTARTLTNKANVIRKVLDPTAEVATLLIPNGSFHLKGGLT